MLVTTIGLAGGGPLQIRCASHAGKENVHSAHPPLFAISIYALSTSVPSHMFIVNINNGFEIFLIFRILGVLYKFLYKFKKRKTFHFAYQVCNIYQIPTMYDHSNFEERALVGQFVEIWLAYYRVPI